MSKEQKADVDTIFSGWKNSGNLDYVACWYKKSFDLMKGTDIRAALVSTNSITQGEQVPILWKPLFQSGIHFDFAYRTFIWDSEANLKAHVHCVIIGFSIGQSKKSRTIYSEYGTATVQNINCYLVNGPDVFVENRKQPLCCVPSVVFGNMPNDGGYLSNFSDEEKENITKNYPDAIPLFKRFLGAAEFINNKVRWCLWLNDVSPVALKKIPPIIYAISQVKELRASSNRDATRKLADTPALFGEIRQPQNEYILIPRHSSQNRKYVPLGLVSPDYICGDANLLLPDATLFHFGIMMSNVHNAWISAVCGRIKSDYRYSVNIVYNNFPWPTATEEQKAKIEQTAQGILDARALYRDCSLADLYDPLTMPEALRKAHRLNDAAVMKAYGLSVKDTSEADCVAFLMKRYQELAEKKDF